MESKYNDPFLNTGDRIISEMGRFARMYVHSDPTSCIVKQGMIVEYIVTTFLREIGYRNDSGWDIGISEKLRILRDEGYWNIDLFRIVNTIRKHRNKAVHQFICDESICRKMNVLFWSTCICRPSGRRREKTKRLKKSSLKNFSGISIFQTKQKAYLITLMIWSD